jgi:hypothetical protein
MNASIPRADKNGETKELIAAELRRIHGERASEAALRAHVMRPVHLLGVSSDRGREDTPPMVEPTWLPHLGYELDVNGFTQALQAALTGLVAGYALRLHQNGSTIATQTFDWAKEPQDMRESWTPNVRMHVASLSKILTAIAMTKLLNDAGIPYETPIIGYLPTYWVKGPNVDEITFAELMTHTSGLAYGNTSSRSDFEFMKSQIAAGTTHIGDYNYQNMNFGLCRILMCTIWGLVPVSLFLSPEDVSDHMWDFFTVFGYIGYVAGTLFPPADVAGPTLTHEPADALAYNVPVSGHGWNSGDLTTMAGAAGWHMSVGELLSVMGAFRRAGTIMSPAQAQTMLDDGFGIDWTVSTPLGTYYAKNGIWEDGKGHMEQGVAFYLPLEMELVVLVNSPVSSPPAEFLYSLVANAYTDNIVVA